MPKRKEKGEGNNWYVKRNWVWCPGWGLWILKEGIRGMMRESYVRRSPGEPGKEVLYMTYFASWPEIQHLSNLSFLTSCSEGMCIH